MGTCEQEGAPPARRRRGGRKPKLTPEQELALVAQSLTGVPYRVLGERFGVSRTTAADVVTRHKARKKDRPDAVDPRRALPYAERDDDYVAPGSKLSEGAWKALLARRAAGESVEALVLEYGVSVATIHLQAAAREMRKSDVEGSVYRSRWDEDAPAGSAKLSFRFDPADPAASLGEMGVMAAVAAAEGRCGDYLRLLQLMRSTRLWVGGSGAGAGGGRSSGGGINPGEAAALHPAQRPPEGAWTTWLFLGGRGAGKTLAGARWLHARAMARPGAKLAMIGATRADVREVMVEGPAGLRSLGGLERPRWEAGRGRLVWENGSEAHAFSADAPERLRGPQFEAAWADEFCAWSGDAGATLAVLRMGLRLGDDPRLAVTSTPRPIAALRALVAEAGCARTHAPTGANAANLAPAFLETLQGRYGGSRLAAQELDGLILEDAEGALWRRADLLRCLAARPVGPMERVVVAVDPPAGAGEGAACGIVVAGRQGGRFWVLADRSLQAGPADWARAVAAAAAEFGADAVAAEANQGGEMVRAVLRNAGVAARVELRRAGVGKRARAQPVAALYEQGRVAHCGDFPLLEEEMCGLGAEGRTGRCDRVDALVWALTELCRGGGGGPRVRVVDW